MYKVVLKGFPNKAIAEQFIAWYGNQGEQFIDDWLECRTQEGKINAKYIHIDYSKKNRPTWEEDKYVANIKVIEFDEDDI